MIPCALMLCGGVARRLERFSNECKTKTKVITLVNQKGQRQSSKPIKTRRNHNLNVQVAHLICCYCSFFHQLPSQTSQEIDRLILLLLVFSLIAELNEPVLIGPVFCSCS